MSVDGCNNAKTHKFYLFNTDMFTAGYPAAQSTTHSYSQSTQGYGTSGYESTPATAAPAASQSYGSQPGYTAQSAYPGYGQQATPSAPQRYVYLYPSLSFARLRVICMTFISICFALSLISYNANSQPASYNQSSYSQPAAYGQQQQGYQSQQAGYGQQQGYPQQSQQQQPAPPAYPPQAAGSYGQPPSNQYNQQGGPPNYNQSNHYSKLCVCCFF